MKISLNEYDPRLSVLIEYGFMESQFGEIMIAKTCQGICVMEFSDDRKESADRLRAEWTGTEIRYSESFSGHDLAEYVLPEQNTAHKVTELCLRGTRFQREVWEALLKIPFGHTVSYSDVAAMCGHATAIRAAASAVASNRISIIIPCHRVIRQNGDIGNYRWGQARKQAVITWEKDIVKNGMRQDINSRLTSD